MGMIKLKYMILEILAYMRIVTEKYGHTQKVYKTCSCIRHKNNTETYR